MVTKHKARITKDASGKKIKVIKEIDANVDQVWKAWTQSKILDQWWAPKPWKTETDRMDFRNGGSWIYRMVGPNNESHSARIDFDKIDAPNSFMGTDYFVDERGNKTGDIGAMRWKNQFFKTDDGTRIEVDISADKQEDLKKILDMGFEQGFTAALDNLEDYLSR